MVGWHIQIFFPSLCARAGLACHLKKVDELYFAGTGCREVESTAPTKPIRELGAGSACQATCARTLSSAKQKPTTRIVRGLNPQTIRAQACPRSHLVHAVISLCKRAQPEASDLRENVKARQAEADNANWARHHAAASISASSISSRIS